MSVYILLTILLLGITVTTESVYTPVIQTRNGLVRGEVLTTLRKGLEYSAFQGIPYAKPPFGHLRFKPPVAKENWAGVLDAIKEVDSCIQYSSRTSRIVGSENCLFLNVFTPHIVFNKFTVKNLKSVLVYIYGGGFGAGSSSPREFGPDFLLEDDVIVVTMNYRVGPFGFLNLFHENATGNAGLKDQHLALKWVNQNIIKFGGNPQKVTIMGQSAGAVSVDLHVLSDMSSGLFSQSIALSGSSLCLYWSMQSNTEAKLRAFKLASKLGFEAKNKDELLQFLYSASGKDIASKANDMILYPFRPSIESPFIARNEQKFLTKCAIDKYRFGKYNKGPHMTGFTSAEAKTIARSDILDMVKTNIQSMAEATDGVPVSPQFMKSIVGNILKKSPQDLVDWASDLFFVTGIDSKQKFMSRNNKYPIYYYRFAFENKMSRLNNKNNVTGVAHGDDIAYLFYNSYTDLPYDDPEVQLTINRFVRLITNFVKYGNPTPYGSQDPLLRITWPDSARLGRHLEINQNLKVGPRPISDGVKKNEAAGLGSSRLLHHCF